MNYHNIDIVKPEININETFQKLFPKLENPDVTYQNFVKHLAKYHFEVKAIIQVCFRSDNSSSIISP